MTDLKTAPGVLPAPPWADSAAEFDPVTRRSIGLGFDFNRAIIADPSILDGVPDGAVVVLIPPDDPALAAHEINTGLALLRQGCDVYFRHVRPGDRVAAAAGATD